VAGQSADEKPAKNVTVFTTPTCSWCTTLKRHLDAHQIRYREVDVSKDQKAAEAMVRRSGQQGVPQTDINGQMIVGFDRERINRLLDIR
jgi:glutaredoxin-like YruB-family protein